MKSDIRGRLRNQSLQKKAFLLPLFEALVNSIDSLAETKQDYNEIKIQVIRKHKPVQTSFIDDSIVNPIESFEIIDNGKGFTADNYDSFNTLDSLQKLSKGGKGIGRISYLLAFEKASVDSIYLENGKVMRRSFVFSSEGEGISDMVIEQCDKAYPVETRVSLLNYLSEFEDKARLSDLDLIDSIHEHLLLFFINPICPSMILLSSEKKYNINDLFTMNYGKSIPRETIKIGDNTFALCHFKSLYQADKPQQHRIVYCANNREVKGEYLAKYLPDFQKKLKTDDGRGFLYSCYVEGDYLDLNVNAERNNFRFLTEDDFWDTKLTSELLRQNIMVTVVRHLERELAPIKKEKVDEYMKLIDEHMPQYKYIVSKDPNFLNTLPLGLGEKELDEALHKKKVEIKSEVRKRGAKLISREIRSKEDYKKHFAELVTFIEDENAVGMSDLAQYVIHRRVILDLLKKYLAYEKHGKYHNEEILHDLIFTRKTDSMMVSVDEQNLWIIDEKLSFNKYIASDRSLKQNRQFESNSGLRPDIIAYDYAMAFTEATEVPFHSITIVEYKKPGPETPKSDDNPIQQVNNYIREIKKNGIKMSDGRIVPVDSSTFFYCYIICDINDNVVNFTQDGVFYETPDRMGYYCFNDRLRSFTQIISWDKLLQDAMKRNKILFSKLGI